MPKHVGVEMERIFYFKLSPCSEYCIRSFGYFPGVELSFGDGWGPSVRGELMGGLGVGGV
jgi:hypothetical protein